MVTSESSEHLQVQKFQRLFKGFIESNNELGFNITTDANGDPVVDICKVSHQNHSPRVLKQNNVVCYVWSPVQVLLSLVLLTIFERGFPDIGENLTKLTWANAKKGGKDTELQPLYFDNSSFASDEESAMEDVCQLVERFDGRNLEKFVVEDIAHSLMLDLHPWVANLRKQMQKPRERGHTLELAIRGSPSGKKYEQNGQNSKVLPTDSMRTSLKKLYPEPIPPHRLHPYVRDFSVLDQGSIGKALVTHRSWQEGDFMARFDGLTVPEVMLHTLQKSTNVHLWDPHFIGNLAHSCNPNVLLDMAEQEMWASRDIEAGAVLSMDYASTEDRLFRTFQCQCTAAGCRGEITGRKQRRSTYQYKALVNGLH